MRGQAEELQTTMSFFTVAGKSGAPHERARQGAQPAQRARQPAKLSGGGNRNTPIESDEDPRFTRF
jgi:hypothetical protein